MHVKIEQPLNIHNGSRGYKKGKFAFPLTPDTYPDTYEVEEIDNPWFPGVGTWLVLKGTKNGLPKKSWEHREAKIIDH